MTTPHSHYGDTPRIAELRAELARSQAEDGADGVSFETMALVAELTDALEQAGRPVRTRGGEG